MKPLFVLLLLCAASTAFSQTSEPPTEEPGTQTSARQVITLKLKEIAIVEKSKTTDEQKPLLVRGRGAWHVEVEEAACALETVGEYFELPVPKCLHRPNSNV